MQLKVLDKRQEAKFNMYQVVEMRCDENAAVISANVAFQNAVTDFKALVAQLGTHAQQAGAVITGAAQDKSALRKNLVEMTARIAGLIYAYAAKTGNNTLKEAVNFSKSELKNLKDAELAPVCQNIHDAGNANRTALVDYGVTTEKLAALQTAINDYTGEIAKPRSAIVDRKVTKANIRELFKQADFQLTALMDNLIEDFAADHPDFVAQYKSARIIIDPATGKQIKDGEPDGGTGETPPA